MKPQLRGDYSKAAADYAVEQDWSAYTAEDHALYRRLFERQATLVPRYAHDFFGHVPLLFDRTYADHLYEYGKGGLKAMRLGAVKLAYCVDDPRPQRLPFDLERIMRSDYQIDRFQESYYVIDSFAQLMRETARDFTPIYERIRSTPGVG